MNKYQDILKQLNVPEGKSTDQAWNDLQSKLNSRKPQAKVVAFSWKPMVSVAAAAAAQASFSSTSSSSQQLFTSPPVQHHFNSSNTATKPSIKKEC